MDIVIILSSLNKIGLVAFLITLGFLIYEIILLRKASKAREKPNVPKFQEGSQLIPSTQITIDEDKQNSMQKNKIILFALIFLLIFFGIITMFSYLNSKSTRDINKQPLPIETGSNIISKKIKAATPKLTPTKEPTPTVDIPTPTSGLSPTPSETSLLTSANSTLSESAESTPSPTLIKQLPLTGYINNLLILFSVSSLFLLFSLLF